MKKLFAAALLGALLIPMGCGRDDPKPGSSRPRAPGEKEWSEDEMATNPEGYLNWADGQLASQVSQREEHLRGLSAKRKEINATRDKFVSDYEAIANLENRLGTATRRAEEEERWPVSLAGKTFTKEQTEVLLADTKQFLTERKALASAYDGAVAKLDAAESSLRDDIARLSTLREKVAADLVGVKADRSNPEMAKLRKTEAEIAHYSKVLTSFADVSVKDLPKPKAVPVSLQSVLK